MRRRPEGWPGYKKAGYLHFRAEVEGVRPNGDVVVIADKKLGRVFQVAEGALLLIDELNACCEEWRAEGGGG